MILAWRRWRGSTKSVSLSLCQWRSAQRQHQVQGEKGRATRAIDYSRNFGMRLRLERSVSQETTFRWTVGEWWRSAQKVQSITYRCPLQVNPVAHLSSTRPVVARMPQSQQTPNDDTVLDITATRTARITRTLRIPVLVPRSPQPQACDHRRRC